MAGGAGHFIGGGEAGVEVQAVTQIYLTPCLGQCFAVRVGGGIRQAPHISGCRYFEEAAAGSKHPRKVANWVINNLTAVLAEKELNIETCPLAPKALAGLVDIIEDGLVSNNQAREVLEKMWESGMTAAAAADAMGFKKTDTNALDAVVAQVLEENPDMVAIVKGGNMKLINALTGKVMKVSNPKPNPKMVTEIILAKLGL